MTPPDEWTRVDEAPVSDRPVDRWACAALGADMTPLAEQMRVLTVADLADDAVVQNAEERGAERPRPLVAGGALIGLVPGCSV